MGALIIFFLIDTLSHYNVSPNDRFETLYKTLNVQGSFLDCKQKKCGHALVMNSQCFVDAFLIWGAVWRCLGDVLAMRWGCFCEAYEMF